MIRAYLIINMLLFSHMALCQQSKFVDFEVIGLKKEFKEVEDRYITFKLTNLSNIPLLIPNVIYFGNVRKKLMSDLDFGFELCKVINGVRMIDDSCSLLLQPLIPEEGYKLNSYKKGSPFSWPSIMPFGCFTEKGEYQIRFTYFPKNKGYREVKSKWFSFKVI